MAEKKTEATRILPCSVVLLSAGTKGKKDAMTATAMFVSEKPPLITVSVAKHIVSHELIEQAGEFVLNVASPEQAGLARQLGATHGDKVDKFKEFNVKTAKASHVQSPMIKDSYANLECRVITSMTAATYTIYLAEVVAFQVNGKSEPIAWFDNTYYSLKKLN
jgi:flavin reductase (DIM6/NTAB) family NADH-FMN oxidoreductase RutF